MMHRVVTMAGLGSVLPARKKKATATKPSDTTEVSTPEESPAVNRQTTNMISSALSAVELLPAKERSNNMAKATNGTNSTATIKTFCSPPSSVSARKAGPSLRSSMAM